MVVKMKKIGIVAAMLAEYKPLTQLLGKEVWTKNCGGFIVKKFNYLDNEIYIANSGIGEILASACAQTLIISFGVDMIINYGLAGGKPEKEVGKMFLVKGVVHYDFDLSAIDNVKKGEYERFGAAVIETDEGLRDIVKDNFDLEEVICASADKFVASNEIKNALFSEYGAEIFEMESAGILIICKNSKVPCLILKAVSDNGENAQDFNDFVASKNIEYVKILKSILDKV